MNVHVLRVLLIVTLLFGCWRTPCDAGSISSLDDVEFWAGSGANRTALVIDWNGDSSVDESLAWGYRWEGTASGEEMLRDILAADSRLFAKISAGGPSGIAIYGFGYDSNNDALFAIDDGTSFDADGIHVGGPADGATSVDANDLYTEGWFLGFWHVGTALTNPFGGSGWASGLGGISNINLVDNAWTSLAFTTDTFNNTAFAENPIAAEQPGPVADFDGDNDVDGDDFLVWQQGFGILSGASLSQGDADCNKVVDADDLQLWEQNFGLASMSSELRSAALVVPELPTSIYALLAIIYFFFSSRLSTRRSY